MPDSVLVLGAHPDDEVLGCGGTIAKLTELGAAVHVAFVSDGVGARTNDVGKQKLELEVRRAGSHRACNILGVDSVSFGDFPDNRLDTIALLDVVKFVESLIEQYKPEAVYSHHGGDLNVDHRRVHEAVVTACRPRSGHSVRTVLFFEVPSSTEWQMADSAPSFAANWFVDISATLRRKLDALDAYAAEMRQWPHPRSRQGVEYLARWRGATVGVEAAEAFALGRQLK